MASQLLDIFGLSVLAMFNPSLLAAVTVMLVLPNPRRLMLGYLLGAYTTSITLGLVIVFALPASSTEKTSKHSIGPIEDLVIGALALAVAWLLRTGRDEPLQQRRRRKREAKLEARRDAGKPTESLPIRVLGKGDPKLTFVIGAALSFPGVSYLDALDHLRKLHPGTIPTILLVVFFCVMQQLLLELPLLGYLFAPERTQERVWRFREWIARRGRTMVTVGAALVGVWLCTRGIVTLS